ncbi:MAG: class I SAM-dependent methyltransferase [Anaerolineales bacterium]
MINNLECNRCQKKIIKKQAFTFHRPDLDVESILCESCFWHESSKVFDSFPERYDIARPGYPDALIEEVIEFSQIPADGEILEIGSGTGKATECFAKKGYHILCIEPGENLARLAREKLPHHPNLSIENTSFEAWELVKKSRFHLAVAAQAFHWIDPNIGYAKIFKALKPEGTLALFWNMYDQANDSLFPRFQKVYRKFAPQLVYENYIVEDIIQDRSELILASGYFHHMRVKRFSWSEIYSTQRYLTLLETYSDHVILSNSTKEHLYQAIADLIESEGGYICRPYMAVLYLANKRLSSITD